MSVISVVPELSDQPPSDPPLPTWKRKTDNDTLFYHLCGNCDRKSAEPLLKAGWQKIPRQGAGILH